MTSSAPPPEAVTIAHTVAVYYARKCWWSDAQDLEQEAMVECLRALRAFDPDLGTPVKSYLFTAARRAIVNYLLAQSSPVSARSGHRSVLVGLHAADLDLHAAEGEHATACRPELHVSATADSDYDYARWRAAVATRIEAVIGRPCAELSIPVILGLARSSEVAEAMQVPVATVYSATARAKSAIGDDVVLWELWRWRERCL